MNLKRIGATVAVAFALFTVVPATISSAGGGTVAGPCGTLSSVTASNVTLKAGTGGYTASPLAFKGSLKNCSIYIQRYWIDFSEPARPASGGLNSPVVTCTTNYRLMLNDYVSSGSSLAWSGSTSITPTPVVDPSTCVGTHTVRVDLKSRTDGRLLNTVYVTYTVTKA
jgi:hypothetical protein